MNQSDQAAQDLLDISALEKCPGWARFHLRRIRQLMSDLEQEILESENITPAEREFKRQQRYVYQRELTRMEVDKFNLRKQVDRQL